MATRLSLLFLTFVLAGCAAATPLPQSNLKLTENIINGDAYFRCSPSVTLDQAEVNLASSGWEVTRRTQHYVQTGFQILTQAPEQKQQWLINKYIARESLRITVIATDKPMLLFRIDARTVAVYPSLPSLVYEQEIGAPRLQDMPNAIRRKFNFVRMSVCGDKGYLPMEPDLTPPIPPLKKPPEPRLPKLRPGTTSA